MQIWVDADACPVVIKETLFRAAIREEIKLTLVANQALSAPNSPYINSLQVAAVFDAADDEIVRRLSAGDLVVTSDIPLAAEALEKQAVVISPRGEQFSADSIKARVTMRDFMETMRASGIQSSGPGKLSQTERQQFANQLDRWLNRWRQQRQQQQ